MTNKLPRGVRIDHGYVQVRLAYADRTYCRNFGKDSPLARELAEIHLAEKKKEILMGKFGIKTEIPAKRFAEVSSLFFNRWSKETDAEGRPAHGDLDGCRLFIERKLNPYFGSMWFHDIRPIDVIEWRKTRLKHVLGTSVNREQAVLSSIFGRVKEWIDTEAITAFKQPVDKETAAWRNPCESVEKAPNNKRKRVLTVNELKALKAVCREAKDGDLWEICEMALKSLLRKKDLFNLEAGIDIDAVQAKTQRSIHLPVSVLRPLNYKNFRKRWEAVRKSARLVNVQFRDLRKTGANLLKMKNHSNKLISEFLGHASTRTTEIYMVEDAENLKPLAKDLEDILKSL